MRILSIETSCDETSLAIIEAPSSSILPERAERVEGLPIFKIRKLLTASQVETHRPWGGVVPNLAKREHQINLPILFKKLVGSRRSPISPILRGKNRTKCDGISDFPNIDLIAVTVGPGLEPCLWQGIEFAKTIKKQYFPKAKIVPTNHLHGHMYSFLLSQKENSKHEARNSKRTGFGFRNSDFEFPAIEWPAIQLLVSGGHTILFLMESLTKYKKLGETRDDAAGEAFDKVARMLGLPYPGGPEIEKLTKKSQASNVKGQMSIVFPRPMLREKNYDFSFSGLKTSVLYYLKNNKSLVASGYPLVAHAFQDAVIDVLTTKTLRAAKEYNAKSVILSGGVAANQALRNEFKKRIKTIVPERNRRATINFLSADKKFQGDNAAMIAVAGYITSLRKKRHALKANGNLNL